MRDSRGDAYDKNDNMRTPDREGEPPRPSTEPKGSKASTRDGPTATDPGSGEPKPPK